MSRRRKKKKHKPRLKPPKWRPEPTPSERPEPTPSEKKFAEILESAGVFYKSQYWLRNPWTRELMFLDFWIPVYRIAVEIDGSSHRGMLAKEADRERTEAIKVAVRKGLFKLYRFWNSEVRDGSRRIDAFLEDLDYLITQDAIDLCFIEEDPFPYQGYRQWGLAPR